MSQEKTNILKYITQYTYALQLSVTAETILHYNSVMSCRDELNVKSSKLQNIQRNVTGMPWRK